MIHNMKKLKIDLRYDSHFDIYKLEFPIMLRNSTTTSYHASWCLDKQSFQPWSCVMQSTVLPNKIPKFVKKVNWN